jgi:BirA family biotin operon repressor/biotin-[acetyl-CoA-carboxylase] ligase
MKIGERIVRVTSCSSTNDLANEMALGGEEEGTVILAEEQLEGRGTKGRRWYSAGGKGLYFSVILRPLSRDMSLLPLAMGLAVRDALIESAGLPVSLRWPNDLVYHGKKLGGILCEASFKGNEPGHVVLGVGINLTHTEADFPEEFRAKATSLRLELDREIDREDLMLRLWRILGEWYVFFVQGKKAQIVKAFEEASFFSAGERVRVQTEEGSIAGTYLGIDLEGRFHLRVGKKERSLLAAEVIEMKK